MWRDVSSKAEIDMLLNETNRFHDSCIKELYYVSGAYNRRISIYQKS